MNAPTMMFSRSRRACGSLRRGSGLSQLGAALRGARRRGSVVTAVALCPALLGSGCTLLIRNETAYVDDVRELVETRKQDIAECYDVALAVADPEARPSGNVTVDLTFQETKAGRKPNGGPMGKSGALDGHLRSIEVVDAKTTAPRELVDCVTRSLTGLVLEPPDHRPAHGQVSFVFEVGSDKKPGAASEDAPLDGGESSGEVAE